MTDFFTKSIGISSAHYKQQLISGRFTTEDIIAAELGIYDLLLQEIKKRS